MKRILSYLITTFLSITPYCQVITSLQAEIDSLKTVTIINLEFPFTENPDEIISHTGYSFLFSNKDKQAIWIAYQLTNAETVKLYNRSERFTPDKSVKSGTANDNDYKGSGYDRGHLAPAADMGWSVKAMEESFYYSNMSPQKPSFNRGIWKQLEELTREWAVQNKEIYIVTGGVLNDSLPSIGKNKVTVPKYFYKVILDYSEPSIKGIGFILPNESSKEPLQRYAVTIDSVERFTGINFFYQLPEDQEKVIESTLTIKSWNWNK